MSEGSIGDFFKRDSSRDSTNPAELRIEVRWGQRAIALVSVDGGMFADLIRSFGEMISNSD